MLPVQPPHGYLGGPGKKVTGAFCAKHPKGRWRQTAPVTFFPGGLYCPVVTAIPIPKQKGHWKAHCIEAPGVYTSMSREKKGILEKNLSFESMAS